MMLDDIIFLICRKSRAFITLTHQIKYAGINNQILQNVTPESI